MSLSHRLNTDTQCYLAVGFEPQVDGFVENAAGYFEKAADTNATQFSLPFRGLAAGRKAIPVRKRLRLFQHLLEFAAVVDRPVRRFVRHRRRRNEVAQTQLRGV